MSKTKIKDILSKKGVTAKELAAGIGVSESALSVMISDKGNPTVSSLSRIADFLGVGIQELFTGLVENPTSTAKCPHCGKSITIENVIS